MCTAKSVDSAALGVVGVRVRECSSIAQEYSSVPSALVPRLSKMYDQDIVHGVIVETVQALGYQHPTRKQLQVMKQFVW